VHQASAIRHVRPAEACALAPTQAGEQQKLGQREPNALGCIPRAPQHLDQALEFRSQERPERDSLRLPLLPIVLRAPPRQRDVEGARFHEARQARVADEQAQEGEAVSNRALKAPEALQFAPEFDQVGDADLVQSPLAKASLEVVGLGAVGPPGVIADLATGLLHPTRAPFGERRGTRSRAPRRAWRSVQEPAEVAQRKAAIQLADGLGGERFVVFRHHDPLPEPPAARCPH